jgi:hypothetical protein
MNLTPFVIVVAVKIKDHWLVALIVVTVRNQKMHIDLVVYVNLQKPIDSHVKIVAQKKIKMILINWNVIAKMFYILVKDYVDVGWFQKHVHVKIMI